MGSGNTKKKSRLQEEEGTEIHTKTKAKTKINKSNKHANTTPRQPQSTVNEIEDSPELTVARKSRQAAETKILTQNDLELEMNESRTVGEGEREKVVVSKTLERTKVKLSARGYTDKNLIHHCDKSPQLFEVFISVFDPLEYLVENISKDEKFYSNPDALRHLKHISSFYSQQRNARCKIQLGEFLANAGFANVVKEFFLKFEAAFPNILSYDRELEYKRVSTDAEPSDKPHDTTELKQAQDLLNVASLAAINYTDLCDAMNLAFNEVGLVPILVSTVAKLKDCTAQHVKYMDAAGTLGKKTVRGSILSRNLGTLHNLSKRVPTRVNFYKCNAVKVVLPLIDDKVTLFACKALLLLAYLIDEENNNLIMANKGPIKYLVSLIDKATKKSDHRYLGFSNSELAEGLAQIAINDSNKKQIVSNGAIPILTTMISGAKNEEEEIAAAEALWVLAFDQENKETMKNNERCMEMLHKLKESSNDRAKKAASGALWEIEGKQQHSTDTDEISGTTNHVMISYQWDVQKMLIQVKDRLQAAGYRVWMDLEQMGGSTLEAMAKAVENSTVVIICVSQKYKESSNCRSEAEYAFQLKKDIIPLMMENNYKPDGWLGMIMGSKLWFDFSQRHGRIDPNVRDLQKELGERGKGEAEIVQVTSVDVVDARPTVDISGWTHDDVTNWMKGFDLVIKKKTSRLSNRLTGPGLTRLNSLRNESPDFYYFSLKDDIGLLDVFDVMLFTDELEKLVA